MEYIIGKNEVIQIIKFSDHNDTFYRVYFSDKTVLDESGERKIAVSEFDKNIIEKYVKDNH